MKNIIKHNLKQKIWLTGCVTLLFILCRPMIQLMTYENEKRYAITKESLVQVMESFFLPDVFTDYIPTVIACVVIAIVFFSYLFSKRKVDLYHSIPVDRKHLFIANYVSGVIVYAIALLIEFILCVFIAVPNQYMTFTAFEYMITAIIINLVHFLFGYGVVITAIMLSGNAIVALAGAAVIGLIYPVYVTLIQYFQRYFYVTYDSCEAVKKSLLEKYYWLSPITSYATLIERVKYEWNTYYYEKISNAYVALIMPIILTIVITIVAYWLYMKRPSEAAGRAISFRKTRAFIEVPIVIACGLVGGWFMSISINTYKTFWIWIGAMLGVILSHCILEVILNESFKAIVSHKRQFVLSVVVTLIILGIYNNDVTKFDYYTPDKESVASATVYFSDLDSSLSSIDFVINEDNPEYYISKYNNRRDNIYVQRFTDSVMIEKIIGISNIGVSCVNDMISNKYNNNGELYYDHKAYAVEEILHEGDKNNDLTGLSEEEAYNQAMKWMDENGISEKELTAENDTMNVSVCYELKNGKIVLRQYNIPISKLIGPMNEVYKTDEYKRVHYDLFKGLEEGNIFKVEVYDNFENKVVATTEKEKDLLLKTYLDELSKINIDTISQVPIGRISPLVKISDIYNETYSGYFIYPEFTKTLALIESFGADMSGFTSEISAEDVVSVNISSYDLYAYEDNTGSLYVDDLMYDKDSDEEFINELASEFVNANNAWSNIALIAYKTNYGRYGVDTSVNLIPVKGIQRYVSVLFKDGKVPEKIKKDIAVRLWQQ